MASSNMTAASEAALLVSQETGSSLVSAALLDLASLDSVSRFATDWAAMPLHILVNNADDRAAGVTEDGLERIMQVCRAMLHPHTVCLRPCNVEGGHCGIVRERR